MCIFPLRTGLEESGLARVGPPRMVGGHSRKSYLGALIAREP